MLHSQGATEQKKEDDATLGEGNLRNNLTEPREEKLKNRQATSEG